MPTVLQVLPSLKSGGVERGTVDLARYLVGAGWKAVVASSGGPLVRDLEAAGAVHVELPAASKNPLTIWANTRRLTRVIREHRVDIVHARSRAPAWSALRAAKAAGRPLVTTFHGIYGGSERRWKRRYNSVMTMGQRVIAVSDYVAEHIVAAYGVDPARIVTIHRGVDLAEFDPRRVTGMRISALAEKWQVGMDRAIVMLPARVARGKGHVQLLRAVAEMPRDDFIVVMVGGYAADSAYVKDIQAEIARSGLGERVRFAGACDDMPAAYMLADVVTLPADGIEAFGRVAVEAQAMGRRLVITAIGGLTETIQPACTGWLVPPDNVAELADALDLALALPKDGQDRLAERARDFVTEHFSVERMCARTLDVYGDVLGTKLARETPRRVA